MLKVGSRLKSAVCGGEVMVVLAPEGENTLTCGGAPMAESVDEPSGSVDPDHAEGIQIGKRYVGCDGALEVLCVKAGDGSLAVNGEPLAMKDAKKLPKTD